MATKKRCITRFLCKKGRYIDQGIIFSNGMVYIAYDAWRMLSKKDVSSDSNGRWYMTLDDALHYGYRIFKTRSNVYTHKMKEVKV